MIGACSAALRVSGTRQLSPIKHVIHPLCALAIYAQVRPRERIGSKTSTVFLTYSQKVSSSSQRKRTHFSNLASSCVPRITIEVFNSINLFVFPSKLSA